MSAGDEFAADTAEDLYEEAPCGYLSTTLDGRLIRVNRTFETWTGFDRDQLVGKRRFQDLLSAGGRIYHETHYAPLLQMQGSVSEIAVEIVRADGTRLPALINSVLRRDAAGAPREIRTTVFGATDRRRYEQELLSARRREHEIALRLQRNMLARDLPATPELEVGFTYDPGVRGLEIGGDWYDVFWVEEERRIAIVIGDVVGRGLDAAATMVELRSATRALASTGIGPGRTLETLEDFARRHRVGRMTTLICAELDLAGRTLTYSVAGHLPPLLLAPGQPAQILWGARSTPLDAFKHPARRTEARIELEPGSTFMLYTDGLVERRAWSLDHGIEQLRVHAEANRELGVEQLVGSTARALAGDEQDDDVCVLAARLL